MWEESVRQGRNFHPLLFYFEQKRRGEVSLGPGTNWLSRFWLVVLCGRRATINQAQPVLSWVREALQVNGTERLINHHAQAAKKVPGSEKHHQRRSPHRPSGRDEASQNFLAPGVPLTFAQTETFQSLPSSPISHQPLPRHDATNKPNKGICILTHWEQWLQPVPRVFLKYVNSRLVSVIKKQRGTG